MSVILMCDAYDPFDDDEFTPRCEVCGDITDLRVCARCRQDEQDEQDEQVPF